ncbi:lasso peptide biosynthesis B2 protein [Streptomyces sp. NPDC050161]|uniref:lasso peptide biosynthesis B2 protein n=1 Tax=Streptomyces sp. NPDC050161 TaxID=3365604 RepID=UPI00378D74D8
MSVPFAPEDRPSLSPLHRVAPLLAVALARALAHLPPRRIRGVLHILRSRTRPATGEQALAARQAVIAVSARCAGEGCVQRSLATTLLCRIRGVWPTWCTGVRSDPFRAHAWVEADGQPVGEPPSTALYHRIMSVPSLPDQP